MVNLDVLDNFCVSVTQCLNFLTIDTTVCDPRLSVASTTDMQSPPSFRVLLTERALLSLDITRTYKQVNFKLSIIILMFKGVKMRSIRRCYKKKPAG